MIVNIHEAKTHFSRLAKRALAGEEIVIARNGTPLLKLTPVASPGQDRIPGLSRNLAVFTDDFSERLDDEMAKEFEK